MTDRKHGSSLSQEEIQQLEEQDLEAVTGGIGDDFKGLGNPENPKVYNRMLGVDLHGNTHPQYGTYLPPSDPQAVRNLGLNLSTLGEHKSVTMHDNGIDFVRHERASPLVKMSSPYVKPSKP